MLQSPAVLMVFEFLDELLVQATGLLLSGPVCGMTLPLELTGVATGLLDHFGLLFMPAGVYVLDLLGVRAPETRGLALGVSGHGIATARAFSESEAAGSFASIGTALNASLTAALVPLAVWALGLM